MGADLVSHVEPPALKAGVGLGLDAHEAALWTRWRHGGDESARERLLELHLPYAHVVAAAYYVKRFNNEIEFGDYLQLASLGLIEAMQRFEPELRVQFRTFASRRMHGSIVDGIERMTEKQQQIAARQRLEHQRREAIKEGAAHSAPGPAGKTGRTSEQILQYVAETGLAFALGWILDGTGMLDRSGESETLPFYRSAELQQLRQRMVDIVNTLPTQERRVIQSHYFQDMPFERIATVLGLSRGRVSQVHRKALTRLKHALQAARSCDVSW